MRKFVFEVTFYEDDLIGDEFWEDAVARDGTGIAELTDCLVACIEDRNIIMGRDTREAVVLKSYKEYSQKELVEQHEKITKASKALSEKIFKK